MSLKKIIFHLILIFVISWLIGLLFFPAHSNPSLRTLGFLGASSFYFVLLIVQLAIVCIIFPIFYAYFAVKEYDRSAVLIPVIYVILSFMIFFSFSYMQGKTFGEIMQFGSTNETVEDTGTGILTSVLASNPVSTFSSTAEYSFMERSEVLPWYFYIVSAIMGFIAFFLSFYLGFVKTSD